MARNKARRPGGPPRSPSASEGPPARPDSTAEGRTEAASPQARSAAERPRPEGSPAADRPATAAGPTTDSTDSPAQVGTPPPTGAAQRPSGGGAARPGAEPSGPAPRSAASTSSRSWLIGIGGGVIGGVIVALLVYVLPQEAAELAEIRGQLDQLGQSVGQLDQGPSEELLARLEALEAAVAGEQDLPERLQAVEGIGSSLGERIATLEQQFATAGTGDTAGVAAERLATLEGDVADLAATVAQLRDAAPAAGAGDDQAIADLTARIDALEARLGQAEDAGARIEGLSGRLDAVERQIAAGQQETTGLTDEVVTLSGQVGALSTRVDALAETVDQLQQQLASQEDRRTRAAALALAVAQLDAAIEEGAPFEDLLGDLRGLDAEDPVVSAAVAGLEPAAVSGAPSLAALRSSFDRIANRIVHAARAPEGDGLLAQAAGNLMSLVTVRPVGADVEGEDAAARVARAEAALDDGDLAAAVAELEALDGAAAAAAAPWLAEARERLDAQAALARLQDHATLLLTERP